MDNNRPSPLLAVTLLFRSKDEFMDLPHVVTAGSLFLDSAVELPLRKACKRGSVKLLDRIWTNSEVFVNCDEKVTIEGGEHEKREETFTLRKYLRTDKHYKQYQFTQSLVEAIDAKNVEIVKWLVDKFQGCAVRTQIVSEACMMGSIEILQYFYDNDNSSLDDSARVEDVGVRVEWGPKNLKKAAAASHGDVVWWLLQHRPNGPHNMVKALEYAVTNGDVLIAEWLLTHGARWPNDPRGYVSGHHLSRIGRLDVLKWLDKKGQLGSAMGFLANAAGVGQLEIVRWLIERDIRNSEKGRASLMTDLGGQASVAIHAAAVDGHLQVAKYLRAQMTAPSNLQYALQAQKQRRLVQHLKQQLARYNRSAMISGKTMAEAAGNGFLDVVQWLIAEYNDDPEVDLFNYGESRSEYELSLTVAMDMAAKNGHLEVLKYLHDLQKSMQASAKKRKRAEDNKKSMPTCTTNAMDFAAENGHLVVIQWLHNNRTEGATTHAMDAAARFGHLRVVQWLHSNRSEGCTTAAMNDAASGGHLSVVKWLHINTSAGCTKAAMDGAATLKPP